MPTVKPCAVCGKEFEAQTSAMVCGPKCLKDRKREQHLKYRRSGKGKVTKAKYDKRYAQSESYKAFVKRYKASGRRKKSAQKYDQSEKGKRRAREKMKRVRLTEKGKQYHRKQARKAIIARQQLAFLLSVTQPLLEALNVNDSRQAR